MSVAQSRGAARRMRARYGRGSFRTVGDIVASERRKAARTANIIKKPKS